MTAAERASLVARAYLSGISDPLIRIAIRSGVEIKAAAPCVGKRVSELVGKS